MRDWRKFVQCKLAGLRLAPSAKADVIEELAAHLEEAYKGLREKGMTEELAAQKAMLQVPDWKALQRSICAAKKTEGQMQNRLRQLWIPGFLTLTLSTIFLMTLQKHGFQPRIVSWSGPGTLLFYVPWLLTLPLFGALGAYVSSRAGGSRQTVLLTSLFPVLTLAAAFFVILPVGLIIDHQVDRNIVATGFLMGLIGWVLVPGAALLVGALPIQILRSRQANSNRLSGA